MIQDGEGSRRPRAGEFEETWNQSRTLLQLWYFYPPSGYSLKITSVVHRL
jgi:hypothetical protein